MTQGWFTTLCHPKMHAHTKFRIPLSNNIRDMIRTNILKTRSAFLIWSVAHFNDISVIIYSSGGHFVKRSLQAVVVVTLQIYVYKLTGVVAVCN